MEQGECKSFECNLIKKKCFSNTIFPSALYNKPENNHIKILRSKWPTLQPPSLSLPTTGWKGHAQTHPSFWSFSYACFLTLPAAWCLLLNVFLHTSLPWESSTFLLSQPLQQQQLWPTLQSVSSFCSRSTDTLRPRKAYANLIFTSLKCKLANTSI